MAKGRHYRYRKLDFWAERGMINIVDERYPPSHPASFKVVTVGDILARLKHFSAEVKRHGKRWPDEREAAIKMIEDFVMCCRDAKAQGRPDDPRSVIDVLKARRRMMLFAGTGTYSGATPAQHAPESVHLPPIPHANPNKPFTPALPPPISPHRLLIS